MTDPSAEAPRGVHETLVDEKGRLKIPAAFHAFLGERAKLFVTTFDLKTIRLYPIAEWERLGRERKESEHPGSIAEIDNEGRLLIGRELRSATGLTRAVSLHWAKDHVELRGT